MLLRPIIAAGLLGFAPVSADEPTPPAAVAGVAVDYPFALPEDAKAFAARVTKLAGTHQQKLQALLRAFFRPRDQDGLGMVYDNSRNRTVAEVWRDGKANCLGLTAFYVMSARSLGITVNFAEALNTNHWRKVGSFVQFERHVVALAPMPPDHDVVADFMPELRKRTGTYVVAILPEPRFLALFYSNLAVEGLTVDDLPAAKVQAEKALAADPKCSVGWNVLGVVQRAMGDAAAAEASLRKALQLDPQDGAPIGNLELVLRETNRPEEAATYRALGEKVRKKDPFFNAYLAEEALAGGDLEEAAARIRTALRLQPKEPDFLLILARIRLDQGDVDGSLKALGQAKKYADPEERARWDSKMQYIEHLKSAKPPR